MRKDKEREENITGKKRGEWKEDWMRRGLGNEGKRKEKGKCIEKR